MPIWEKHNTHMWRKPLLLFWKFGSCLWTSSLSLLLSCMSSEYSGLVWTTAAGFTPSCRQLEPAGTSWLWCFTSAHPAQAAISSSANFNGTASDHSCCYLILLLLKQNLQQLENHRALWVCRGRWGLPATGEDGRVNERPREQIIALLCMAWSSGHKCGAVHFASTSMRRLHS